MVSGISSPGRVAVGIISRMRENTARKRVAPPDHLETRGPHSVPIEQEEFFQPRYNIVRWGSGVKASMGATRKPR